MEVCVLKYCAINYNWEWHEKTCPNICIKEKERNNNENKFKKQQQQPITLHREEASVIKLSLRLYNRKQN